MDSKLKKILRGISLEIRRLLEGRYDDSGQWQGGDLERRLNEMGVWRDRNAKPVEELPYLSPEDKSARRLVDGYLKLREEAGVGREEAVSEFVRESAYTWANRLFALRCMEARGIIDEVILQKEVYGGRSMVHSRLAKRNPGACAGKDDGLFTVLFAEFEDRSKELPALFDPKSPAVALRPSVASLKKTIALLSGRETARGQDAATDEVFTAPDAFGWAYQYYQDDEKERVDKWLKTKKDFRCEGADIVPKTALYTESYMVKFLVQNSLGAFWMAMHPDSNLSERWEYFVKDADRTARAHKPVREMTFLDPAEGSGHFHLEAFDLFYAMYEAEAVREERTLTACEICAAILNRNLYGIDIDGCSVQIATAALWMKAKERAPELKASDLTTFHDHLVATNIRLPKGKDHLQLFLQKHPEDEPLRPALELVFQGLEHADELGSLLQIEELVDAVLRRLKEESDKSKGVATQPGLFEKALVQGTLPVNIEDYDKWKRDALKRLQTHFEFEGQAADPVQAFFGKSAGKGLNFFNLLAGRYDVVAANPPYLGSANMGHQLKSYLVLHFAVGKRDLYAAFILRCIQLADVEGRVAMVTQQSWMFHQTMTKLRVNNLDSSGSHGKGVLQLTSLEVLVHLGASSFEEISGEVVNSVLFVLRVSPPSPSHTFRALTLTGFNGPNKKADVLRLAINGQYDRWFLREQSALFLIPGSPVLYWITDTFFRLMSPSKNLGQVARLKEGLNSTQNERFLRYEWETPTHPEKWWTHAKGGFFGRWWNANIYRVNWEYDGALMKQVVLKNPNNKHWSRRIIGTEFFKADGAYYPLMCQGSLGVRYLESNGAFDSCCVCIFPLNKDLDTLVGFLNTHLASFLARCVSQSMTVREGYTARLPKCPDEVAPQLAKCSNIAVALKKWVVSSDLLERSFTFDRSQLSAGVLEGIAAVVCLLSVESYNEKIVASAFGLNAADITLLTDETGTPAGWYPFIDGCHEIPQLEGSLPELPREVVAALHQQDRRFLKPAEFIELKERLRQLYESGPGGDVVEKEFEMPDDESEDDDTVAIGTRRCIPSETFVEDLSQKLQVHPISIYWLLKEGLGREGWRCPQEEQRLTQDRFTVLVLRLIGHRWLKQLEVGEPLPEWAEQDGVIPLTRGCRETPLIDRVRQRSAENYHSGNLAALQQEFEEIVGVPLEQWLAGPFFERHISQFKRRPIAWHLETQVRSRIPVAKGKGKAQKGPKCPPVFACLLYYHKLDAGLLPKIRTHYVGILKEGYETEMRTLELMANRTADQEGRRLQLDAWIEELKAFDAKLEQVSVQGFGPEPLRPVLRQYAIADALLSLTAGWLERLEGEVVRTTAPRTTPEPQDGGTNTSPRPSPHLTPPPLSNAEREKRSQRLDQALPQDGSEAQGANFLGHITPQPPPAPSQCGEGGRGAAADSILAKWQEAAADTKLHDDLPAWIGEAFQRLDYFCAAVGPAAPAEKTFAIDPTSKELAPLVCAAPDKTVGKVLDLACDRWRKKLDEVVLDPLKEQLKQSREEQDRIKEELKLDEVRKDYERAKKLADRLDDLKREIKTLREEIAGKTEAAGRLRREIESWTCAEAATWEEWLGTQPLFDGVASLDGQRPPPATIAEFIAQESRYAPDINDGVRVNIAPLQKAGLLHADVLDSKDADKAILDRAEWRADERRWVREGKLPQPGWVLAHGHQADGQSEPAGPLPGRG